MKNISNKKIIHNFDKLIDSPLIITIPHSGREYSGKYIKNASIKGNEIRGSEDPFLDLLLKRKSMKNYFCAYANFPRMFVDLNRHPREINPNLFKDIPEGFEIMSSDYSKSGYGVIPDLVGIKKIYKEKLPWSEYDFRIKNYHEEWYNLIQNNNLKLLKRYNEILIIDIHSMPSTNYHEYELPPFVLGDKNGSSCKKTYIDNIKGFFDKKDLKIAYNYPYAGQYFIKKFGMNNDKINVVQIEINRNIYMNEKKFKLKEDEFILLRNLMEELFCELQKVLLLKNISNIAAE